MPEAAGPRLRDLAREAIAIERSVSVAEARSLAAGAASRPVLVRDRGRPLGAVPRATLELAVQHGLGDRALAELLCADALRLAAHSAVGRVARALRGHSAVVVLGTERGPAPLLATQAELPAGLAGPAPAAARRRIARGLQVVLTRQARALVRQAGGAARSGQGVFLVGGALRDAWLSRATRDVDLVVEGDPAPLLAALGLPFERHDAFGTASATTSDGTRIDVATSRSESYARPAALPRVGRAALADDLRRRDFTVNALALRAARRGFGELLDPHGGLEDLRRRRLRVLHALSFVEDPTRALRGVRLAVRLGLRFERQTLRLLELARASGVFERLSAARLRREIESSLDAARVSRIVRAWSALGLLGAILPGVRVTRGTCAALDRAERAARSGAPRGRRWVVALGLLLHHSPAVATARAIERLAPDRAARAALRDAAAGLRALCVRLGTARRLAPSAVHRICRGVPPEVLGMAAALSANRRAGRRVARFLERGRAAAPDITGSDLIAAGLAPGPAIARGLEAALAAKLDGRARTARSQLRCALRAAGRA